MSSKGSRNDVVLPGKKQTVFGTNILGMQIKENEEAPRRFSFEASEDKFLQNRNKLGIPVKDDSFDIDINDVTKKDDEDIANYIRGLVRKLVNSMFFKGLIFFVITLNAFHVAFQTMESLAIPYSKAFFVVDNFIMGIFVCEIILKWYSGFVIFWKDPWNILDFIIVFSLHFGPWLQFISNIRLLRVLRIIRAFRSLKTVKNISAFRGLSLVVETILRSLPDMANIVLLLVIFTLVLSVVGVKLFGRYVPEYFGDPIRCMFSIFVCFTQDGWVDIFRNFEVFADDDPFTYISATLFFIVTILTAAFIIANLIVAVVTTNLDRVMKEARQELQFGREPVLSMTNKYFFAKQPAEATRQTIAGTKMSYIMLDKVQEAFTSVHVQSQTSQDTSKAKHQRAIYKSDFSMLTVEKLENYFMLLVAFENNWKEHQQLRKSLFHTRKVIRALNEKADARLSQIAEKRLAREVHSLRSFEDVTGDDLPIL